MYQNFVPFYGWVHCMFITHFIYPFIHHFYFLLPVKIQGVDKSETGWPGPFCIFQKENQLVKEMKTAQCCDSLKMTPSDETHIYLVRSVSFFWTWLLRKCERDLCCILIFSCSRESTQLESSKRGYPYLMRQFLHALKGGFVGKVKRQLVNTVLQISKCKYSRAPTKRKQTPAWGLVFRSGLSPTLGGPVSPYL